MGNDAASQPSRKDAARTLQSWWADMGEPMDPELARALRRAEAERMREAAQARATAPQKGRGRARFDPVAEAHKVAAGARTLDDLFAAIEAWPHCELKEGARHTVTHDGALDARVMVIGEGPGREEDERGKPFIGAAGKLLDKMLAAIGLSRQENAFITNVNYWRPPRNADPAPEVLAQCRPFFTRMIALMRPAFIIAVGKVPMKALLGTEDGIMKLHGRDFRLDVDEQTIPLIPVYHPAFLLRQPKMKAQAWADLLKIEDRLKGLGVLG